MGGQRIIDIAGKEWFEPLHPANVLLTGSNVTDAQTLWTPGMLYNETTSDKPRGNTQGTLFASAARTATVESAIQTNYNANGIHISLRVTAVPAAPGSGGLTLHVFGVEPIGLSPYDLMVITNITAVGTYVFELYPGVSGPVLSNYGIVQKMSGVLPRQYSVRVTHLDAQSYTYSVGYSLVI